MWVCKLHSVGTLEPHRHNQILMVGGAYGGRSISLDKKMTSKKTACAVIVIGGFVGG